MRRQFFAFAFKISAAVVSYRLVLIPLCFLLFAVPAAVILLHPSPPPHPNRLLSPLGSAAGSEKTDRRKQVIGFLPYWNLEKVGQLDFSGLTAVYYFAVDIDSSGGFNKADPGWSRLNSDQFLKLKTKAVAHHLPLGITIVNLNPDSIARIVNNSISRDRLAKNVVFLMQTYGFGSLNVDFEYSGTADNPTRQNYTLFVKSLADQVRIAVPNAEITIDAFSDAAAKPRIMDISALSKTVDQIIIMAYDFHRLNSAVAGPVAPLFGRKKYENDVTSAVTDFLRVAPAGKILLGVPFYGYEWPTLDSTKESFVIRSSRPPELSSYHRSRETAAKHDTPINFDDLSKSAWFSYYDTGSGTWRQVWFEDEHSLSLKLDLVNQANLAGIAVFALGYDGSDAGPLWDTVKAKLR